MLPAISAIPVDSSSASGVLPTVTSGAGRVLEPVAFSAVRAPSNNSHKANSEISFDKTLSDIGFGWNSKSSDPIPARISLPSPPYPQLATISSELKMTYLFSMNCRAALMKNSDEVVVAWGEQVGYQSAFNSVILNLEKGDRVYLNIKEGEIFETSKVCQSWLHQFLRLPSLLNRSS
uniref:Uncharacterized protein n=1 Tax=Daphnia galeata TaxID=27404 RepID=A0A8J2S1I3_9CRUS|nr:unnamed protein product [Daphnia galeata]